MPGPMSAPNGDRKLVGLKVEDRERANTGKTALKRGEIKHARKRSKLTRKEFETLNEE